MIKLILNLLPNLFLTLMLFNSFNKKTYLTKPLVITLVKRSMLLARHVKQNARTVISVLKTISQDSIIQSTATDTRAALATALQSLCLDNQKGILQAKTSLAKHIIHDKFPLEKFYSSVLCRYPNLMIGATPRIGGDILTDPRSLNEVKIIEQFMIRYSSKFLWVTVTGDSASSSFTKQVQQPNPDVWTAIQCAGGQGIPNTLCNYVSFDEKSGENMFKSSTKGTLGYITYDSKDIHAFTKQQIFLKDYNIKRLNQLNQAFQSDGLSNYENEVQMFLSEFRKIDEKDIGQLCLLQEKLQDFLVNDVQTNPAFRRSVSLVFTERVDYESYSPQLNEFSDRFQIYLKKFEQRNDPFNENRFYDLNSTGHKKVIYYCMLRTYKEVIDSSIKVKLEYLSEGVKLKFDPDFVEIFKQL